MYNLSKLEKELKAAGLEIYGVCEDGRIDFVSHPTQEQEELANSIKAVHNPIWYIDQRKAAYPSIGDQLDMIYHDLIDGSSTWSNTITSIKELYPKN